MSESRPKFEITLRELRHRCPLLASVDVAHRGLIGKNHAGEVVVRQNGTITPRLIRAFEDAYKMARSAGIIKEKK